MYKTAEEIGNSFPLFQELLKEEQLISESAAKIEKRFEKVNSELVEVQEKRAEILRNKVLGKATDKELKVASDVVEQKEKEFAQIVEEKETISNLQHTHTQDEIREAYTTFMSSYYTGTMKPLEDELKKAKDEYMRLFDLYYQATDEFSRFKSMYAGRMANRNMNDWLPQLNQGEHIFVSPAHLKDKFHSY